MKPEKQTTTDTYFDGPVSDDIKLILKEIQEIKELVNKFREELKIFKLNQQRMALLK